MQEKIKNSFYWSSYDIILTVAFLNWPIKTYILKTWWSAMWHVYGQWGMFTANESVRTILVISFYKTLPLLPMYQVQLF